MKVAADLLRRGYKIAFPFGDDWRYDLILCRDEAFERVQVKFTDSSGKGVMAINCHSQPARGTTWWRYTTESIDWLAIYDAGTDVCYYVPSSTLGADGIAILYLRVAPAKNGQRRRLRWASDFVTV